MILVIIKTSVLLLIPNIVKLNKTVIVMFEIRKEVVDFVGNVQRSEQIGFIDCTKDDIINRLADTYYNLARAYTLYYKIRGLYYRIRYVFIHTAVTNIDAAINLANADIKLQVKLANEYIHKANIAYKQSNRRRGIKNDSLAMKQIDVKDYLWLDKRGVDKGDYVVIDAGKKQ